MKKIFVVVSFLICHSMFSFAQGEAQITDIRQINSTTAEVLTKDGGRITIDFYDNYIFRMFYDPNGGEIRDPEATPPANILVDNPRRSLTPNPSPIGEGNSGLQVSEDANSVSIKSANTGISFNKQTGLFTISKGEKTVVSQTRPTEFTRSKYTMYLSEQPDEYFYGGGIQNGRYSHRGEKIDIVNSNSWTDGGVASPAPFYWSSAGYGVMCYTFAPGHYDFGNTKDGEVVISHDANYLDMFFLTGKGELGPLRDYFHLTGFPVLLPKFGFYEGHLNAYNRDFWKESDNTEKRAVKFEDGKYYRESQKDNGGIKESLNGEGYTTDSLGTQDNYQFSARAVIDRYNAHDMPLGWVLPNDGYGAGYGQTETLDGNIANLKSFGDYARSKGVEIGLWTQSNLHPEEGVSALLQRDIVKEVRDAGVRVLKTDVAWVGSGYSFGLNGVADVAYTMPQYGNNARPFIISLCGWAGTQRYAGIWTGDQTGGKWEYIRFHIPTYIGAGLSGLGNITSDMDGIFGGAEKDVNIRDFEWKTFTPMQLNMDGWGYAPKYPQALGEPAASINRNYLKWKSMLLPYTYSYSWAATKGDKPLIRAMFLDYPNLSSLTSHLSPLKYQYMYGTWFLVAPVYQSTSEDAEGNDIRNGIYLPEGQWIDYFTGDTYEGGKILNNFDAPIWKLPLFVQPGAIIPMNYPNNNPSQIDRSKMLVEIYPSKEMTGFHLYDDDGKTEAYKSGNYIIYSIDQELSEKGRLTVNLYAVDGECDVAHAVDYTFLINTTSRPRKVRLGKTKLREVSSEEELMANEDTYYYNKAPELNRFATPDSAFSKVSIKKNPQLWVHTHTIAPAEELGLTIDGVEFNRPAVLATHHGPVNIPDGFTITDDANTPYALTPSWKAVENADYYEMEYEGQIYSTIRDTHLQFGDLKPQTTHDFKVRAVNADGCSDWAALTATTKDNPLELAINGITGVTNYTNSEETELFRLFDFMTTGDIWFDYLDEGKPYVLTMDLHCTTNVASLHYVPREGGGNGTWMEGQIEVSADGRNYENRGTFKWEANDSTKVFNFADNPEIRYIRITIDKSKGTYAAGQEVYVFRAPGAKVYIPGDINQDNKIDEADLTSYLNYTGLKKGDADFQGYVSRGDIDGNGIIDAYDISEVATKLDGGMHADGNYVYGRLIVESDKKQYLAGDDIVITVKGDSLDAVNALSMELPYNELDMEFVKVEPQAVANMQNMTNDRLHTDKTKVLYPTFVNIGDKETISGSPLLFTIHFKAKRKFTMPSLTPKYTLVDKFMNRQE